MSVTKESAQSQQILRAAEGRVEPVRIPWLYRLGLAVVALAMILLPLVYLALIALVLYAMLLHGLDALSHFGTGGSARGRLYYLIGPQLIGAVLVLFMIKPLFARRKEEAEPQRLSPEEEPLLFAFVEAVCRSIGAPNPAEIRLDSQVNASASFRRGFASVLGNDLVLTIGAPLVLGLNLRQLAGVLAHEFGHFAQGAGMRLTYVIRRVNAWFSRVVYERDALDARLEHWSKNGDLRLALVLWIARGMVWITRKVLWALMMIGHAISCFMLRQMEFDADRYEARFAGSDTFESTVYRLQELNVGNQFAFQQLEEAWQEGHLAEDLARSVVQHTADLPQEIRQGLRESIAAHKTGSLDTHPADRDRIANAKREAAAGVFQIDGPATQLFANFEATSHDATRRYYEIALGRPVEEDRLLPQTELEQRGADRSAAGAALDRYLPGVVQLIRPLWPLSESDAAEGSASEDRLRALHEETDALHNQAQAALAELGTLDARLEEIACAESILGAGLSIDPESFNLPESSIEATAGARAEAQAASTAQHAAVDPFLSAAAQRMNEALRLAQTPAFESQLATDPDLKGQLQCLHALECNHFHFQALSEKHERLLTLRANLEGREKDKGLQKAIQEETESLAETVQVLSNALGKAPDPYAAQRTTEASPGIKLVSEPLVPSSDPDVVLSQSEQAFTQYMRLYHRTLSDLALVGDSVERLIGLEPLQPVAPPEEASN